MSHICPNSGEVCVRFDCEQALRLRQPFYCDVFIGVYAQTIMSTFNAGIPPAQFDREYLDTHMSSTVAAMKSHAKEFRIPDNIFINKVIESLQTELALRNIPQRRKR